MAQHVSGIALDELKRVIRSCPVIDNHGHNILRPHQLKSADFLTITTEANGDALADAPKSLAHIRAARQLKSLYGLPPGTVSRKIQELEDLGECVTLWSYLRFRVPKAWIEH